MINLGPSISQIKVLLDKNTEASLTYAALECRLAIERICYECIRFAHDYISHDDLKRWQPRDVVNILIQEVDSKTAETSTLFISRDPLPDGSAPTTLEEYQAMEFLPVGTQVGFDPNKLGKLWNALANLALHISVPTSKEHYVPRYGDSKEIREKVEEALKEIQRIDEGTLMLPGTGEEISFVCVCGATNKRRLGLLTDGQTISCINSVCNESYFYIDSDRSFVRREITIMCQNCGEERKFARKTLEKLPTNKWINFNCEKCADKIYISWRLSQGQATKSKGST